ncbi:MAG: hypothetical protein IH851_05055 [Armatimonadetes bacterium]|nr:hypothetical protein [Armatimonadota bacterium]
MHLHLIIFANLGERPEQVPCHSPQRSIFAVQFGLLGPTDLANIWIESMMAK